MKIHRINAGQRWSDIVVYNGIAKFVEIAEGDLCGGVKSQVAQVLAQAEKSLAKVGSDKSRLLSVTIYITDFANINGLNEVWDAWFAEGTAPSRACVKVELSNPEWCVEMAFEAAAGEDFAG